MGEVENFQNPEFKKSKSKNLQYADKKLTISRLNGQLSLDIWK